MWNRRQFSIVVGFAFLSSLLLAEHPSTFPNATTDQVRLAINDRSWVVVDARLPDAYNGWRLDGIPRGGHIPGSVNFSARWLKVEHDRSAEILTKALADKHVTPDKRVIVYAVGGEERTAVAAYLSQKGFEQLYLYDFTQWSEDRRLPLEHYASYHLLVPPSVVRSVRDGHPTDTFADVSKVKFAEVSWGDESASYSKGHIPTSFHINTDSIEPPPKWMLADKKQLEQFATNHGLNHRDCVILSGEDPTASFRMSVVLRYMGINDVRVLHGGLLAWRLAGYELEEKSNQPPRSTDGFGVEIPANPSLIDTYEAVRRGLRQPDRFTLVDNRTWAEHIGETSGYWYHSKKGRIPGSVYGYAGESGTGSMSYYRNIDNTMRSSAEIHRLWQDAGIGVDRHLSFMCGSGWRAAEVLTYAQVIGVKDVGLYSDGWIGWSSDARNPVAVGVPGK
jgi:thiosulfate/3-mercaptopyruvate sulfurtransferase